ncbi:flavin reductase family protein [Actinomadura coerulea]|uniref:flavin reductase family protein n=1 Tax=Actinomadura coerulea TaxID=46159 RepID=UPI003441F770
MHGAGGEALAHHLRLAGGGHRGGVPDHRGAVAWIDCVTEQLHDAGDHHIVVGRVTHLQAGDQETPLLFHRGAYGSFNPH